MSNGTARIPSSSQTVGPYFRIGLDSMIERTPALSLDDPGMVALQGRVFDGEGVPVPDSMLEFWCATSESAGSRRGEEHPGFPVGFRRVATGDDGSFSVIIEHPAAIAPGDGTGQAPYFMVLVFARGLLRHLLTRVYLADGAVLKADPVLAKVSEGRRATLIASPDEKQENIFHWDVKLQGTGETVFFAW